MTWKICPREAWYNVRDPGYNQYNTFNLDNPALLLGQVFHKEMDGFYSKIKIEEMIGLVEDRFALVRYLASKFSKTEHKVCLGYFNWYASIEANRFIELYKKDPKELSQKFIPLYIEKYVEYEDKENGIYRNGHFDRVDYLGNMQLRLVEYKTGYSYDIEKSHKLSKLRLELYWYKEILEHMEEFKKFSIVDWMLINPTTKQVFVSKFSELTKKAMDKIIPKVVRDINLKDPPERNLNFYCGTCKFKQECLIDVNFNIFDDGRIC